MKLSQQLIYGFKPNFTQRPIIVRPTLGLIFDLEVESEGQRNSRSNMEMANGYISRSNCSVG